LEQEICSNKNLVLRVRAMGRPGRPRKYGPVKRIGFELPYETYLEMERVRDGKTWAEFFIDLFDFAKTHGKFSQIQEV